MEARAPGASASVFYHCCNSGEDFAAITSRTALGRTVETLDTLSYAEDIESFVFVKLGDAVFCCFFMVGRILCL